MKKVQVPSTDSDYNQADEVASNEGERIWDENFERECQQADNIERFRQLSCPK
jgi:hypothetical protein